MALSISNETFYNTQDNQTDFVYVFRFRAVKEVENIIMNVSYGYCSIFLKKTSLYIM